MLEGIKNRAALEFRGAPFSVPSEESSVPFSPICIRSLLPSCEYLRTMPEGELAIHMLLSLSKWQLWRRASRSRKSPQEWTTLPAGSISITGGAMLPASKSPGRTSCRLRRKTWSWASTHRPPSPPRTQCSGSGLGQEVSTSYRGVLCAVAQKVPAVAITAAAAIKRPRLVVILTSAKRNRSMIKQRSQKGDRGQQERPSLGVTSAAAPNGHVGLGLLS